MPGISRFDMLKKYLALIRRGLGLILEYRVGMIIWMLTGAFPLIMLAVWLSLAQDGPIGSYSAGDFVSYYLLALYLRMMTAVWVAWELDNDIRHGELSIKLLHPLNPIHEYISFNLADKIFRFVLTTPLVVLVALLVPGVHYALNPLNLVLFVLATAVAWYLRYVTQYTVGLLAFWISQATTLQDIIWMFFLFLGGTIAPLELLPDAVRAVATYLPFRFMMSFPIEIMLGRLSNTDLLIGFALCAGWLALFHLISIFVWRRGLRSFSAYGA